jgi:regulator of cell morphogenesis and NO signaling
MSKHLSFAQLKDRHLKTLAQYVPIVERVHGSHHPEFHEVRAIFDVIVRKIREAGERKAELTEEFATLRTITDGYRVPADVCESYEAVYVMLREIDEAYHA